MPRYYPHNLEISFSQLESIDLEAPSYFPFDIYISYESRLTSFINGAIYCLEHLPELSKEEKMRRVDALHGLAEKKIKGLQELKDKMGEAPVNFSTELYRFYTQELPNVSGLKPKQIALAEAFYVWQDLEKPTRKTLYSHDLINGKKLVVEQVDVPRSSPLTDAQKAELLKVHSSLSKERPQWFKDLDTWAQKALLKIIPEALEGDWNLYQRYKPSTLRHIPGEANSTLHTLTLSVDGNVLSTTNALRQGVPTSFNMKNSQDRQKSASHNLAQMLNKDQITEAKEDFKSLWGNIDVETPILLGGLVTPSEQAGLLGKILDKTGASGDENNTLLALEKQRALNALIQELGVKDVRFFNLNVGINILSKPVTPNADFIKYAEEFHRKASLVPPHEDNDVNQERALRLRILADAIHKLKKLDDLNISGRNRNVYLAALYDVTIRTMKGLSTGNCKSSKDRFGAKTMVADAMLIYAQEQALLDKQPLLPAYDTQGEDRKRFVNIQAEVYASGHQFLIAHDNSPGSPGIKDEGFMDKDVVEKLHTMRKSEDHDKRQGVFALSKQAADFNKPGTFWQKFGPRIKRYAIIAGIALMTGISIGLMATGVFSPLGIIGLGLTAKLGAAALAVGGLVNIVVGSAAVATFIGLITGAKDYSESRNQDKNTFKNQIERVSGRKPAGAELLKHDSTRKVMDKYKAEKQDDEDEFVVNPLLLEEDRTRSSRPATPTLFGPKSNDEDSPRSNHNEGELVRRAAGRPRNPGDL
jgi:hypothetical protein